jgi:hypothetical protein
MSLDQIYVGVTSLLWVAGLIFICMTVGKVSPVRQIVYLLSIPIWVGWASMFIFAFFTYAPPDTAFRYVDVSLRVLLFGIALMGVLLPLIDRLENKNGIREVRNKRGDLE